MPNTEIEFQKSVYLQHDDMDSVLDETNVQKKEQGNGWDFPRLPAPGSGGLSSSPYTGDKQLHQHWHLPGPEERGDRRSNPQEGRQERD